MQTARNKIKYQQQFLMNKQNTTDFEPLTSQTSHTNSDINNNYQNKIIQSKKILKTLLSLQQSI